LLRRADALLAMTVKLNFLLGFTLANHRKYFE
jgi:hypothetical protein